MAATHFGGPMHIVRPMQARDVGQVTELDVAIFVDEARPFEHRVARFDEELSRPFALAYVAESTEPDRVEAIDAFIVAWTAESEGHVLDVAVRMEARRRGLAGRLLDAVFADTRFSAVKVVVLEVRASNLGARAFYEQRGFELSRVRKAYYPNGEDALELTLELER